MSQTMTERPGRRSVNAYGPNPGADRTTTEPTENT